MKNHLSLSWETVDIVAMVSEGVGQLLLQRGSL